MLYRMQGRRSQQRTPIHLVTRPYARMSWQPSLAAFFRMYSRGYSLPFILFLARYVWQARSLQVFRFLIVVALPRRQSSNQFDRKPRRSAIALRKAPRDYDIARLHCFVRLACLPILSIQLSGSYASEAQRGGFSCKKFWLAIFLGVPDPAKNAGRDANRCAATTIV